MKYIFGQKESGTVFLTITMNQEWFSHPHLTRVFGIPMIKGDWLLFKNGYEEWYCPEKQFNTIADKVAQRIEKDNQFGERILKASIRAGEKAHVLAYRIMEKIKQADNLEALEQPLREFWEYLYRVGSIGFAPVMSDLEHNRLSNKLETIITGRVERKKLKRTLGEYFSVLTQHTERNRTFWSKKELLDLSRNFSEHKLRRYLKKYCWIEYGQTGPEYDRAKLLSLLKLLKNKRERQKLVRQVDYAQTKRLQRRMLKELKLTNKEKNYFINARYFSAAKQYRTELMFLSHHLIGLVYKKAREIYGCSKQDFLMLSRLEFLKLLQTGRMPTHKTLRERQKFCVNIVSDLGRIKILAGRQAKRFVSANRPKTEKTTGSGWLKGSIASFGKVRGAVKIVNVASEMHKIKKGDVLVAVQTIPELLPAMRLACAFVTEQGGITSHAAIVAREMKKPCVIGTKIATKVLKDGDIVEVDANKGIVRQIK